MADSILRLRVDSQEYDNKLKRAAEGIQRYADGCRKAGGTLEHLDDGVEQFVKELGKMETTSNSAKGRINEMTKSFTDLSMVYKRLTDQEKAAPFGIALAQSLDQLKTRVQSAKQDLDDIHKSLNGATSGGGGGLFGGGKLDGMLQVFGGNVMTKIAGMGVGLANEMADAVKQGIELAKAGEGVRIAFERLGRGDILDGLRQATHGTVTDLELMKAAVKFNDFKLPLDELGTMLAFAQQKAKDTGQSVDYMVDSIVTGLGRKSLMILDNLGLSANEVKEKMKETGDMTKAVGEIIREQMSNAGDYIETAADRASQAHVSLQNKMEELGRKFLPLKEASDNFWTSMKIGILDVIGGPLTNLLNKLTEAGRLANQYGLLGGNAKVGRMTSNLANASEGNRQSIYQQQQEQFWRYINPREQQIKDIRAWQSGDRNEALHKRINAITDKYGSLDATKIQAEVDAAKKMLADYQAAAKQILQPIEQKIVPTVVDGGSGGKGGSNKEFDISKIAFAAAAGEKFDPTQYAKESGLRPENILGPSEEWEKYKDTITGSIGSIGESFSNLTEWTPNFDPYKDSMDNMTESLKQQKMAFGLAAQAAQGFGAALSGIEDPAAKAAGQVTQAIASIALGFAMASSNANTAGTGWGWLAWLGAGMSAMATTIATIHSLTGYQSGGMIKGYSTGGTIQGNSYSGDNIGGIVDGSQLVGLNAGELVLNKAQQATLAQNLQSNGGGGMRVVGEIQGEKIVLVANRYFKRTGQGEIVTW